MFAVNCHFSVECRKHNLVVYFTMTDDGDLFKCEIIIYRYVIYAMDVCCWESLKMHLEELEKNVMMEKM